jgi:hypothetical protein
MHVSESFTQFLEAANLAAQKRVIPIEGFCFVEGGLAISNTELLKVASIAGIRMKIVSRWSCTGAGRR